MRELTVVYHRDFDAWWADSPQVRGYAAAGGSLAEVRRLVHEGLPFFLGDEEIQIAEMLADDQLLVRLSLNFQSSVVAVSGGLAHTAPVVTNFSLPSATRSEFLMPA